MKKVGFVVLFFLSLILLAGCQEEQSTFSVEVLDLSGEVVFSDEINYPAKTELSLFEVIDENINIDFTQSQWGAMIHGVEGFYPKEYGITYNYYLGLYVNDEMSNVGIDQVTYEEDMVISFRETTMLSEMDLEIDAWLESFASEYVDDYVNETSLNQYVLAAVKQLELYGYEWIDITDLSYPTLTVDTIGNQFKTSVIEKSFGLTTLTTEEALLELSPTNPYEAITYINALDVLFGDETSAKRTEVTNYLVNHIPEYMDADYAGMALGAISSIQHEVLVETYKNDMIAYIKNAQSEAGISSWGNPNASSTAQVIIGLLAMGEDPRSDSYSVNAIDLIEALMTFKGVDGFKYLIGDDSDDMAFSTPQVFTALSLYKIYRDQYLNWDSPVINLWDLSVNS